jgi:hypothetical protein
MASQEMSKRRRKERNVELGRRIRGKMRSKRG